MKKITLKGARVSAGFTQDELAEKLGVSRISISKWERGETPIGTPQLFMFCNICGFSTDDIFLPVKSTKSRQEDTKN